MEAVYKEAVSKACHPALDAGSPEKRALIFRGLRVKPIAVRLRLKALLSIA
jgi:hypothetical protein